MPQTLLALLALALTALLSFSQQRTTIQSFEVRLRDEYAVAASGMLTQVMELIAARSYDEASTPARINQRQGLPDVTHFTQPELFGRLEPRPGFGQGHAWGQWRDNQEDETIRCNLLNPSELPRCDDIDDLHGLTRVPVEVMVTNGRTLQFEVSVRVSYVDDFDTTVEVDYPTFNKRVELTAYSAQRPHAGALVRLERVIAYDPVKAEVEFEEVYGPLIF